jgi:hypothetical protein
MFSRFHRRTPSNPTSPADPSHSWAESSAHLLNHAHPPRFQDGNPQELSSTTSPAPSLPPITRVSSAGYETLAETTTEGSRTRAYERDPRLQYWDPASNGNTRPRDIHTFSNHQRIPYAGTQRPESAGNAVPTKYTSSQYTRPQAGINHEIGSKLKPLDLNHPFVTAADLQTKPIATGRRPTGARLPTPPPPSEKPVSTFEPVQPRSGKARLNLLNPMSLLARRRTSQAVPQLSSEALVSSRAGNNFSETFDPRIRGTVVHDFSAPRPRRNVPYNDVLAEDPSNTSRQYPRSPNPQHGDSAADESITSPWSGVNHTPIFTENFEEEQYPAAGPHVRRASDLTDLPLPKPPYAQGAQKALDSSPASKSNDLAQKQFPATRKISARKYVSDVGPPVPPKADGEVPNPPRRVSIDPSSTPPKSRPSSKKVPSRNVSGVSAKDAAILGLPKHMKSTSSRFSFDMIGAAEQERLLEDRHRQKALEKKNADGDVQYDDEVEDDFDYDNMDDDDGLEERIPGVNADLDEEDFDGLEEEIPGVNADLDEEDGILDDSDNVAGFTFQQSSLTSPLSPTSPGMASTPRDAHGEVIGFAMTKNSPYVSVHMIQSTTSPTLSTGQEVLPYTKDLGVQGLGLQGVDMGHSKDAKAELSPRANVETDDFPQPPSLADDDLYFDDGIIADPGDGDDAVDFDESVFDNVDTDEYGRPLKTFSSLPTLYSPPTLTADPSPTLNKIFEPDKTNVTLTEIKEDAISPGALPPAGGLAPQPSIAGHPAPPTHGLTQDTLAAYQSALAAAAHAAAANGKFRRDSTPPNPTPSEREDPHPGLITDSSYTSHHEPFSPSYELEDDFDYDDALEDDAIIAAANAEALANDPDGFYGQEFGFYSVPGAGDAEYANGGYFGPRGIEGVIRSQSGRIASREPNLTPITERSEYSNRNSFMNLSMHGPGSVASPGLTQLAGLMSSLDYEGDMSLNALLKLRRGAWGGSQASLHSSNGSPRSAGGADEGSPVGQLPPWSQAGNSWSGLGQNGQGHRRKNSNFSVVSEAASEAEEQSEPGSPTLTMANAFGDKDRDGPQQKNAVEKGKGEEDKDKIARKHRYTGSAESISYLKEDDPVAGERWILERRRTAESGEVEFLGREVVSGGRI